jgi:heme A synthase
MTTRLRVLGILAIIFGSLGILKNVIGLVITLGLPADEPVVPDPMWSQVALLVTALSVLLSAVLLTGGIMILRRLERGPRLLRAWAALTIVLCVVTIVMGSLTLPSLGEVQRSNFSRYDDEADAMARLSLILSIVWSVLVLAASVTTLMLIRRPPAAEAASVPAAV